MEKRKILTNGTMADEILEKPSLRAPRRATLRIRTSVVSLRLRIISERGTTARLLLLLSFAKEGPDWVRVQVRWSYSLSNSLTMKVAILATSGPQVSAIISNVRACVPISIPLLTKMKRGNLL